MSSTTGWFVANTSKDQANNLNPFLINKQYTAFTPREAISRKGDGSGSLSDGELDEKTPSGPKTDSALAEPTPSVAKATETSPQLKQDGKHAKIVKGQSPSTATKPNGDRQHPDSGGLPHAYRVAELRAKAMQSKKASTAAQARPHSSQGSQPPKLTEAVKPSPKRSLDELIADGEKAAAKAAADPARLRPYKEVMAAERERRVKQNRSYAANINGLHQEFRELSKSRSLAHERSEYEKIEKVAARYNILGKGKEGCQTVSANDAGNELPKTVAQTNNASLDTVSTDGLSTEQKAATIATNEKSEPLSVNKPAALIAAENSSSTNAPKSGSAQPCLDIAKQTMQSTSTQTEESIEEKPSTVPPLANSTPSATFGPDIHDWLELTGYHEKAHRSTVLTRMREKRQIEAEMQLLEERVQSINAETHIHFENRLTTPRATTAVPTTEANDAAPKTMAPPPIPDKPKKRECSPSLTSPRETNRPRKASDTSSVGLSPPDGRSNRSATNPPQRNTSPDRDRSGDKWRHRSTSCSQAYDQYAPLREDRESSYRPQNGWSSQEYHIRGRGWGR
ncbi:MAG: hypothetical protein M1828_002287 [Chrysothrix sp. TS-e1954]|nr:MAG: hypothetical protein M1828_002287 [Chrysothrix sp. TS-e1954]